jgi:glycosyltransferase involved in cell wall biosynthesis
MRFATRLTRFLAARKERFVLPKKRYRSANLEAAPYSILSVRPPIFYVSHWMDEGLVFAHSLDRLFEHLRHRRAYFLYKWCWNIDEPARVDFVRRFERQHRRRYRRHRFVHLCNTEAQRDEFLRKGLTALLCNHNAFADENIFTPLEDVTREFDAVYDARLKAYKRHHLAGGIRSLALIYTLNPVIDDLRYVDDTRRAFAHAHFFNHPTEGDYVHLTPAEVNRSLNACRVGLCLSSVEGAMYASIQYLLAGLPVVTTRSLGGRDLFFDDAYVATVDDRPEAVRMGVEELIGRDIPAGAIRARTLEKMAVHRSALIALVQRIYDGERVGRDFSAEWPAIFHHSMTTYRRHEDTVRLLESCP